MAKIEFTGFVDPWSSSNEQHPDWGMKVVEPHRRKNETTDEWETVGRTWRTVKAAYGVKIDFSGYHKGDRLEIIGKEVTQVSERDGKKYYTLTVLAESVRPIIWVDGSSDAESPAASTAPAASSDEVEPF